MLRKIRRNYKRLVAFLLSAAMIITNVGGNAGTVLAAESQEERESSIFMVDGQEILEAVGELGDQEALDKEALEELGPALGQKGAIKKYEKLFLPEPLLPLPPLELPAPLPSGASPFSSSDPDPSSAETLASLASTVTALVS